MSSIRKGWKNRHNAILELENKGYKVGVVERTGKFIKDKDLFGLFDLIALSSSLFPKIRFIQVKGKDTKGFVKKLNLFNLNNPIKEVSYELWCWIPRKGFKKYKFGGE